MYEEDINFEGEGDNRIYYGDNLSLQQIYDAYIESEAEQIDVNLNLSRELISINETIGVKSRNSIDVRKTENLE